MTTSVTRTSTPLGGRRRSQGLFRVAGRDDDIAGPTQEHRGHLADLGFIVDHEDPPDTTDRGHRDPRGCSDRRVDAREVDVERRAFTGSRIDGDVPAGLLHDAVRRRQTRGPSRGRAPWS